MLGFLCATHSYVTHLHALYVLVVVSYSLVYCFCVGEKGTPGDFY